MQILAIMIGIQGSGKSTFCKTCLSKYERVSLDDLHTRNKEKTALDIAFEKNCNIVIDNTNPKIDDRKKYIKMGIDHGYRIVGYFMQSQIRECIERNSLRTGKARIPNTAIAATSNKLQMPSKEEGFHELYYVSITEDGFNIDEWRE